MEDLDDNTGDGLHIASLAGAWLAAVAGFGGLRDTGERLRFDPHLPEGIRRMTFRVAYRDRRLMVTVNSSQATYTLLAGRPLDLDHDAETVTVRDGQASDATAAPSGGVIVVAIATARSCAPPTTCHFFMRPAHRSTQEAWARLGRHTTITTRDAFTPATLAEARGTGPAILRSRPRTRDRPHRRCCVADARSDQDPALAPVPGTAAPRPPDTAPCGRPEWAA